MGSSVLRLRSDSAPSTAALAEALAEVVQPGDVILLSGGLGAGKTAFTQGLGRGLGVTETITSPAFVLVGVYEGRIPLVHLDVYRLDRLQEVIDLGVSELADEEGVLVVEWGEAAAPVLPADFLHVLIEPGESIEERRFAVACVGPGWRGRWERLGLVLGPWTEVPGEGGDRSC